MNTSGSEHLVSHVTTHEHLVEILQYAATEFDFGIIFTRHWHHDKHPLKPDVERCQAESKCITVTVVTDQKVCHKFIFVIITQAEFKQHFNQSTLVKRGYVTYVTIVTAVVNTVFRQCDTCYKYFRYCTISINLSVTRHGPSKIDEMSRWSRSFWPSDEIFFR